MAEINRILFELISRLTHQGAFFDSTVIFLAKFLPYFLLTAFLIFAVRKPGWKTRWQIIAEGALSTILSWGLITQSFRFFYESPRPFVTLNFTPLIEELANSFPSGHAAFFFALATTTFYYNRRLGWWLLALSLLNGVARVIAGVHWPLDILGGIAVGILSGFLVRQFLGSYSRQLIQKENPANN